MGSDLFLRGCEALVAMNRHALVFLPGFLFSAAFLPGLAGCSSSARSEMGTVWGTVLYKEKPVTGGNIHFVQGKTKTTLGIRGDGTYSGEVPVGPAKIAIETESVKYRDRDKMLEKWEEEAGPEVVEKKKEKGPRPGLTAAPLVYFPLPDKFSDPEQSGLSFDITSGRQEHDFNLE
jgi:hypothetical protein